MTTFYKNDRTMLFEHMFQLMDYVNKCDGEVKFIYRAKKADDTTLPNDVYVTTIFGFHDMYEYKSGRNTL